MIILRQDPQAEKRLKNRIMVFIIVLFAIAYSCVGQENLRVKFGDYWYSYQLVTVQNTDTINFYSIFYPTPYEFSGIGVTIKSNEKCIGKATIVITYDSGVIDYIGCFGEINCDGNCFFRLSNDEIQHMKSKNIRDIQILNPLYNKTYTVNMGQFRKDWYATLLKN